MSSINSFADSLFRFLFGWARTLLQRVWRAAFSGGLSGFFTWLGDHWLVLTLGLCLAGTAVDFIVWMIRWRPYLVWRTKLRHFLRWVRGERAESTDPRRFARGYRSAVALEMPQPAGVTPPAEEHWTEAEWSPALVWQQMPPQASPAAPQPMPAQPVPSGQEPLEQTRVDIPVYASPAQMPVQPPAVLNAGTAAYSADRPAPMMGYPPPAPPVGYDQPVPQPVPAQPAPPYSRPAPGDYAAAAESEDSGRIRRFTPAADYELPPIEPSSRPNSAYATDLPAARRKRRSDKYDRKRATWRQRLVNATEEEEGMLDGLPPVVDRQQAFHEPVFPQQYQTSYPSWPDTNQTNGNQSV